MVPTITRRIRFDAARKRMIVRTRQSSGKAELSTVGHGPWIHVSVKPTRKRSQSPVPAVRIGRAIVSAKNKERVKRGQKPIDLSDWGKNQKMRAVRIVVNKDRAFLEVEPRRFSDYLASREESSRHEYAHWRELVRQDLRGKRNLLQSQIQMLASGTLLTIGDKYIVLPKRPEKAALYPGQYHLFAGYGEAPLNQFKNRRVPQPHQTARRELMEEIGVKKGVELLGKNFKKTTGAPPALAVIQNLERNLPYPDVFYLGRVKTANPDQYLKDHFEQTSDGRIVPKQGIDKWEMRDGIVIELSSQSIGSFITTHSGQITPMALVALKALQEALKSRGR